MKNKNFVYAFLSMLVVYFYSSGMEQQPKIDNVKEKLSLIAIIKIQQDVLGENISLYIPLDQPIQGPAFFQKHIAQIKKLDSYDPKSRLRKVYEQALLSDAITCINLIIYHHPLHQLEEIENNFNNKSLYFLRRTIEHNEKILKKNNLFEYYQQMTKKEPKPVEVEKVTLQPILQPITPSQPQTHQQPQERKNNEINLTALTRTTGLKYDYPAYLSCHNQNIPCRPNSPFIYVEIIQFNKTGQVVLHNQNMPLPLSFVIDNEGNIRKEIFLSFSKRPFKINDDNNAFHKRLPTIAAQFYKNINDKYNHNGKDNLIADNVIQKQNDTYVHGNNSCKPLLEHYFQLWGIPEIVYKPIEQPQQPQNVPQNWLARLHAHATTAVQNVTNFIRNMYHYVFG